MREKRDYVRKVIDRIMDQVFACMPDDLSKNWLKMGHFLWVRIPLFKPLVRQHFDHEWTGPAAVHDGAKHSR